MVERLSIIIRTAGERTVEICRALAGQEAPWATIVVICERPFEAALRKTYEIAIELDAPWTMTIDGDVLLRRGAISEILAAADTLPPEFIQIEGRVHDKLIGTYRQAGHRLYRTSLLPKALTLVPRPGEEIRPEFSTLRKMALLGHPSRRVATVAGIHDYEQYHHDLFRKAFVHANKHREFIPHFIARAKALIGNDDDFLILLHGLWKGMEHSGPIFIDIKAFADVAPLLASMGLREKPELQPDSFGFDDVAHLLAQAGPAPPQGRYDLQTNGEWTVEEPIPPLVEPPSVEPPRPNRFSYRLRDSMAFGLSRLGERLRALG